MQFKNLFYALILTTSTFSFCDMHASQSVHKRLENLEKRVSLLEKNEITYGPITVSHIRFEQVKNYLTTVPGQKIQGSFHYRLDSSQQEFLSKNHLIVGIAKVAAESCVATLYGVWDSTGKANFELITPLEEGEYEVRIAYLPGATCEEALASWNVLENEPSKAATIGFINVVNP